jgi:hypothetical protein
VTYDEFLHQLYDLSYMAGINEQWYREQFEHAHWWARAMSIVICLIAVLSTITAVTAFSKTSKANRLVEWASLPTAAISIFLVAWAMSFNPTENELYFQVRLQRWIDFKGDVADLYLEFKDYRDVAANKSADALKTVPTILTARLRILETKKDRIKLGETVTPSDCDWDRIQGDETQRRWGDNIRTKEDLDRVNKERKDKNLPPLETRVL